MSRWNLGSVILAGVLMMALAAGCGDDDGQRNNASQLEVVATVPASGAVEVDVVAPVEVTFSSPVTNPAGGSVMISPSVPGLTLEWTSTTHLNVTFGQDLAAGQVYTVTVRDFAAEGLAAMADHVWSFTTAPGGDPAKLQVTSTTPTSGQSGVSTTAALTVTFTDPVSNPGDGSVNLAPEATGVTLTWSAADELTITHDALAVATDYTLTLIGFTAVGKDPMDPFTLTFTTAEDPLCEFGPDEPYSTNPTLGQRVPNGSITIDGHNDGEWTDGMLIALDLANDDPRSLGDNRTFHETPWDLTHLWAAWDDDYLYLAWQYVDVTDVIDPTNAESSHGSYPAVMDLIQWIVLDTIPGQGAAIDMWGKNGGVPYWGGVDLPDYQIYIASNLWQGFVSRAVDGVFPVDDGGVDYHAIATVGIDVAVGTELAATTLWGVSDVDDRLNPLARVEFVSAGHDGTRDSFYEMQIPLSALGNPDLEALGIGVMLGQGEYSCLDTIPHDEATLNTPGVSPSNSTLEWEDEDTFTTPFASIGHFRCGR